MDQQPEPQSPCFSFHTGAVKACATSPARVPTFTALPGAATFKFAPVTPPSAKPLAFLQPDAASTLLKPSASYRATPSAADLTCYETLVCTTAVSQQPIHRRTGLCKTSFCTAGLWISHLYQRRVKLLVAYDTVLGCTITKTAGTSQNLPGLFTPSELFRTPHNFSELAKTSTLCLLCVFLFSYMTAF